MFMRSFDKEKLRQYELQKLKYYFGVATFTNIETASAVFDACDGLEYETSSNTLDLRFVPNDIDFSFKQAKDMASFVPDAYVVAVYSMPIEMMIS
jgi:hypothetical protein